MEELLSAESVLKLFWHSPLLSDQSDPFEQLFFSWGIIIIFWFAFLWNELLHSSICAMTQSTKAESSL